MIFNRPRRREKSVTVTWTANTAAKLDIAGTRYDGEWSGTVEALVGDVVTVGTDLGSSYRYTIILNGKGIDGGTPPVRYSFKLTADCHLEYTQNTKKKTYTIAITMPYTG